MLRGLWLRLVLLVMTVLCATPVLVLVLLVPRWSNLVIYSGRLWSRTLLAAAGARVRYHGRERAREHVPCIFIANHQSMVDIWIMLSLVTPETRFVAKQELFRIPLFGWALKTTGFIPINRSRRTEAMRSLGLAAERIRAGRSVVLFPEGTRGRDGSLQPFKTGAFHLALQAGVPVVPVAITGSFAVVPTTTLRVKPGPVDVYVEPAVDVSRFGPEEQKRLMAEVHEVIAKRFGETGVGHERDAVPLESS